MSHAITINLRPLVTRFTLSMGLALGLFVGFTFSVGSGEAQASCNQYRPAVTNDDLDGYMTYVHTVPSTSTCQDINISNISLQGRSDIVCGTFWVQMYPSSGGYINTAKKFVCSLPPNGPLYVLASNVKNGTRYRVFYDYLNGFVGVGYHFTVTD